MKNSTQFGLLVIEVMSFTFAQGALAGPDEGVKNPLIEIPEPKSRWSAGAGYSTMIGLKAEFSGLGGTPSSSGIPSSDPGTDRTYDDGFNRVDSTGNTGGITWNWGYEKASQYDQGASTISMSSSSVVGLGRTDGGSDEWHPGLEVFASYSMGDVPQIQWSGQTARWGWKMAVSYNDIDISNNDVVTSGILRTTDTFELNGVIPPPPGYAGTFEGPGPVLSDVASRTTTFLPGGAMVSGTRDFDVDLFIAQVGPYLELPFGERLLLSMDAGFSFGIADGSYRQSSTTSVANAAPFTSGVDGSNQSVLPGFSIGGKLTYQMTDTIGLYLGGGYRYLDEFEMNAGKSMATLDFSSAFVVQLGGIFYF